ncbi:hypothetical protein [Bradyrhizobium zhanjiangense]|uniref:Uncharacterized protein n=1 Tax=Bradyrhizobium zhanjiangense TaxID=1325107 RepID=A0A4Q0Q9V5_9BRAD|nr:hypothetical protein [Bradyrhizobium zhanjiangense]RXG85336.1 hypothetical protein EAS61_36405 [Bradyrhizobium zhanjiangense]
MKAQHVQDAPGEAQESFAALAAAVHPAWHQAIIRLANVGERICERLGWVLDHNQDNDPSSEYARNCRELVDMMLEYLDGIDPDPDLEPSFGSVAYGHGPGADECEPSEDAEPSLGSLDRALDQVRWAMGACDDAEHEHDGREPEEREDDPAESGIADWEGLLEQVGMRDWTGTVMA